MAGLREQAEADLDFIIEDDTHGFATSITFSKSGEDDITVKGIANRIGVIQDQDTGLMFPGKTSFITVRISSLTTIPDETWNVAFTDISGNSVSGKIKQPMPDNTLGKFTCFVSLGD